MEAEIYGNPDFGEVVFSLAPGEKILIEAGSMSRMSPGINVKGTIPGGILRALARKFLGGETFFIGEYSAQTPGFIVAVPKLPGEVRKIELNGNGIYVSSGSFLAAQKDVEFKTKFLGLKGFLSGKSAFAIYCRGYGSLFFNAFGGIVEKQINGKFIVDTGHAAAWEDTLDFKIKGMGSLKSTLLSGEGFVLQFEGKGKIWLQTRTLDETASWLSPYCY